VTSQRHRGALGQALEYDWAATPVCGYIAIPRGSQSSGLGEAWRLPIRWLAKFLAISVALMALVPGGAPGWEPNIE
jgi:hypothetical protein